LFRAFACAVFLLSGDQTPFETVQQGNLYQRFIDFKQTCNLACVPCLVSAAVQYFVFFAHLIPKKKPASGGLTL
jgi:hypothetical protein